MSLTQFFCLSLAFGVGFFTFLADSRETGGGFLRVTAALCGSFSMIALAFHLTYGQLLGAQSILLTVATLSFAMIYFFHQDEKTYLMRLLYITHNVSLLLAMYRFNNAHTLEFAFSLSSSLLLGSITYAMVMGHWYLVTPRLSEKPLQYATYFMWLLLVIKIAWTGYTYLSLGEYFVSGTNLGAGYIFNWLMLTMRIGWGYVVIAVMSYFAYRLISMRSIQSATGMLYAMTFFILVAELISNYMFFEYGMMI